MSVVKLWRLKLSRKVIKFLLFDFVLDFFLIVAAQKVRCNKLCLQ